MTIDSKYLLPICAVAGITVIDVTALLCGIDGVLMGLSVTALSGLGGFKIGKIYERKFEDEKKKKKT